MHWREQYPYVICVSVLALVQLVACSKPCLIGERSHTEEVILLREGQVTDSEDDTYSRQRVPHFRPLDAPLIDA